MSVNAMRRHLDRLTEARNRQRTCTCSHTRAEHVYAIAECRYCDCTLWRPEEELQRARCLCSHDETQHDEVGCVIFVCGCRQMRPAGGAA